MRAIALIIIFVQLLACGAEYGNEARVKFIPSDGLGTPVANHYLIQAVHQQAWLMHYGFSDNDLCRSSSVAEPEKFEEQLRDSIITASKLWLQPLREMDRDIVNEFNLRLVDTEPIAAGGRRSDRRTHTLVRGQDKEQLGIVFHCAENDRTAAYPNSFITMGTNGLREAHLYHYHQQRQHFPLDRMSDTHMFMMTTIIHELGHAFGLADTYVSSKGSSSSSTSKGTISHSTGGSKKTVGKQPMAMMGIASLVGLNREHEPFITADDIEGMRWLYRLAHDNASVGTCPADYVAEEATRGCAPRYPLIFAVKKGDLATVIYILRDDNMTINTCDQHGNTALFYAQQHRARHGSNIDKLLLDNGADPSMACAANKQPANNRAASVADVQLHDAEADPYGYRKGAHTGCGTLKHASSPEHTLLLLLALLAIPLLVARVRGAKHTVVLNDGKVTR